MKIKLSREKAILLYNTFNSVANLKGVKFAYGIAKNKKILQTEIDAINEAQKQSKEYELFEKERAALAEKHSKRDENGKPIIVENQYIVDQKKIFNKEFEALKETHKTALEKREAQMAEVKSLIKEEVEIDLWMMDLESLPDEITPAQMEHLILVINEEKEKISDE